MTRRLQMLARFQEAAELGAPIIYNDVLLQGKNKTCVKSIIS